MTQEFQLFVQVAKHSKGLRVGGTRSVSHLTIELTCKGRILPGEHLIVFKGRHYSVVVDSDKNLNITRVI